MHATSIQCLSGTVTDAGIAEPNVHALPAVNPDAGQHHQDFRMLRGIYNAVLIYNPAAGRLRGRHLRLMEGAQAALRDVGIAAELLPTSAPGIATALARQAVAENRQLVIACGGDGTINEVVNGLAGSQIPLAVLPGGTANVLAKELGIPWDVHHAARLVPLGTPRRIALGLAIPDDPARQPRYFICLAGAGPDGQLVHAVNLGVKARIGILAYWLEGIHQFFTYSYPEFQVFSPQVRALSTLTVIGRTRHYGGPVCITTEADLFSDQFEVFSVSTRSRWRYAVNFLSVLAGRHRQLKENFFWKTDRVRCEPLPGCTLYAQVDGEPIGTLPVEFRIVPDALTLIVPETLSAPVERSAASGS